MGLEESVSLSASEHWNDGQLDADLRLAEIKAKRRLLEDSYAALQFVRMVHKAGVTVLHNSDFQKKQSQGMVPAAEMSFKQPWYKLSTTDRLIAFEEAYQEMLEPSSEAEGIDTMDSDELEFIVAALVDLDEVAGANGAKLVTDSANSPNVDTRRAIVQALASAPSVWALGNAGVSALQRLAKDSNKAVAAAAGEALQDLKAQLEQQSMASLLTFPSSYRPDSASEAEDDSASEEEQGNSAE